MLQLLTSIVQCLADSGIDPSQYAFIDETSLLCRYERDYALSNHVHMNRVGNCADDLAKYLGEYEPVRFVNKDNHGKNSTVILDFYHENLGEVYIHLHPETALPQEVSNINGMLFSDISAEITRAFFKLYDSDTAVAERIVDLIYDFPDAISDYGLLTLQYLVHECQTKMHNISKAHKERLNEILQNFNIPTPSWLEAEFLFR